MSTEAPARPEPTAAAVTRSPVRPSTMARTAQVSPRVALVEASRNTTDQLASPQ